MPEIAQHEPPGHEKQPSLDLRRSLKRHLDTLTLRVTIASTIIALLAAVAAFWSGYEAHKARVDDERPFLDVDVTALSPDDPIKIAAPLRWRFYRSKIVASGKSPAINVRLTCAAVSYSPSVEPNWQPLGKYRYTARSFPYILPNRSAIFGCHSIDDPATPQLDPNMVTLFGVLQYQDQQGTAYQTPFCFGVGLNPKNDPFIIQCHKTYGLPDLK